jgi:uncharacterized protein (TIGR02646 family)
MRYITKGPSPHSFETWKAQSNADWQATWGELRGIEKADVKKALLEEQGYICCYCGLRINHDHRTEIEHVKPRSACTEAEKIDYNNFAASCDGGRGTRKDNMSCNAKRGDQPLFLTPHMQECEEKFLYTEDGQILPKDDQDESCKEAIRVLGLEITRLQNKRGDVIRPYARIDKEKAAKIIAHFSLKLALEGQDMYKIMNYVVVGYLKEKFNL